MRFREATESDIPDMVAAFEGSNALPLEPRVRQALPLVLRQLLASPACTLSVFESESWSGMRVLSFAGGLFVRDALIEAYLAAPYPGLVSAVLAGLVDGRSPLLTLDEIRQANSGAGLDLAVFPISYGRLPWDHPQVEQMRRLAPQAFMRDLGGYRLRAIYYEVFADEVAGYIQAGGYRLLHDHSALAGSGFLGPNCRPRMLRLTVDDLTPRAMNMATQMFNPPRAELGLTPAEQRVALRALDGASDRVVAETLGLSSETVRSHWRSIYQRLATALPGLEATGKRGDAATRGFEKRRIAVEYLRQNMQELRPLAPSAQRSLPSRPPRREGTLPFSAHRKG